MSITSDSVSQELGLLRQVASNIEIKPHKTGPVNHDHLRAYGFARARIAPAGVIGLRLAAASAFEDLAETMFSRDPATERGTSLHEYQRELFGQIIGTFSGQGHAVIQADQARLLANKMSGWVTSRVATRLIFVACVISPWPSPECKFSKHLFASKPNGSRNFAFGTLENS